MKKIKLKRKVFKDFIMYMNIITRYELYIAPHLLKEIDKNVYMVKDPSNEYVHKNGACFAVCTYDKYNENKYIIIDEFFNQLPKTVQNFVIYHEIGHITNNHTYEKIGFIKRSFGLLTKNECEADDHAANMIGISNTIKSLYYIVKYTDLGFTSKVEIMKRIRRLRSLQVE